MIVSEQKIGDVAPVRRDLAAGSTLFRQGDATFGLFYLETGGIRLVRVTPDGTEVAMHTVRPGEFLAEASLFVPCYHCDAITVRDSVVWVYPKNALIEAFSRNPQELWQFTSRLAHQVQNLRTRLTLRQIRSARERVLQALRLRCGKRGSWEIEGTLKHLAQEIGLTHEALYRALADLERSKVISRTPNSIALQEQ